MDMQRGQRKGARTGTGELLDVVEGQLPVGAPTGWLTYNKIIKMALLCRRHIRDGDRRTDWLPWAPGCMVGLANGATPSAQLARQISPAGAALWEGMRSERGNWGWRSAQRLPGAAAGSICPHCWHQGARALAAYAAVAGYVEPPAAHQRRACFSFLCGIWVPALMRLRLSLSGKKNPCLCRPPAGHGGRTGAKACVHAFPIPPSGLSCVQLCVSRTFQNHHTTP